MNRYKPELPYVKANDLYFIRRAVDPPDLVHPIACAEGPLGISPMLFRLDDAEQFCEMLNENIGKQVGVEFVVCRLHEEESGPRERTLRIIGHDTANNVYLRDPGKRVPQGEDDWDDDDTIGIHLQERNGGRSAYFSGITKQGRWCIRLKNWDESPGEQVVYDDRELLHKEWICD